MTGELKETTVLVLMTTMKTQTKVKIKILVPQIAENTNHAKDAKINAPVVMSSMRFTAHSKILPRKFAISKIAKKAKMLALPLSKPVLMKTVISLNNYKLM
jgi:hypothetical protein